MKMALCLIGAGPTPLRLAECFLQSVRHVFLGSIIVSKMEDVLTKVFLIFNASKLKISFDYIHNADYSRSLFSTA